MANGRIVVKIADMQLAAYGEELITYALGSCLGICLKDKKTNLAALIHIMLPINMEAGRKNTMKYADTGIRETIKQMEARGARRANMVAKVAGGAKMFDTAPGSSLGNIGKRNVDSMHMILRQERVVLLAEDVGGTVARTISFDPGTGMVTVKCYGKPDYMI